MTDLACEYEELLTVSDFARIFKLSESDVRSMIRQKRIKAIKIGGSYRILAPDHIFPGSTLGGPPEPQYPNYLGKHDPDEFRGSDL